MQFDCCHGFASVECHRVDPWVEAGLVRSKPGRENAAESQIVEDYRPVALSGGIHALCVYTRLAEAFVKREVTYDTDVIFAFAGLAHALTISLRTLFLCNMPCRYLDWALLWQPDGPLLRRKSLPSWSWAGWSGCVSFGQWGAISVTKPLTAFDSWNRDSTFVRWRIESKDLGLKLANEYYGWRGQRKYEHVTGRTCNIADPEPADVAHASPAGRGLQKRSSAPQHLLRSEAPHMILQLGSYYITATEDSKNRSGRPYPDDRRGGLAMDFGLIWAAMRIYHLKRALEAPCGPET